MVKWDIDVLFCIGEVRPCGYGDWAGESIGTRFLVIVSDARMSDIGGLAVVQASVSGVSSDGGLRY